MGYFQLKLSRAETLYKVVILVATGCISSSASSSTPFLSDELIPYATHVDRTPKQPWSGDGIYLGNGYVLTAAHVVGHARETHPRVVVGDRPYPTEVVKEGTFENVDLTLLRVDPSLLPGRLQFRRLILCHASPITNQPVVTVVPEGVAPSHILDPRLLPADVRPRFPTDISDVATTGNSGSGVFDAQSGGLMGIMSRKIEAVRRDPSAFKMTRIAIAKYFVPSNTISEFLPDYVRF